MTCTTALRHNRPVAELNERRLIHEAGDIIFERGRDYVRHVRGLVVMGSCATAIVQASSAYVVELEWGGRGLKPDCSCPHFARGYFCKHVVAVGLAALAVRHPVEESAVEEPAGHEIDINASDPKSLVESVSQALGIRGFIDYGRSFEVAREADYLLDELEERLMVNGAEIVRPALLKALTRLRALSLRADDSGGSIGDASQRAADLYARACREGTPDPVKLARWLVKFRDESPGWPITELGDFVDAFDERGMRAYRKAVDQLDEKYAGLDKWKRFEINRIRLELADHDGDVDRAIVLLSQGEHPEFGAIVDRLRAVGRDSEASEWTDRAVAEGRISTRHGRGSYWLDPTDVADEYLAAGRDEDALVVLRENFVRTHGLESFQLLMKFADRLGRGAVERGRAMAKARELATEHPFSNSAVSNGAVLVEIALAEKDLDAAWKASDTFGPGHQWRQLSAKSETTYPRRAADLFLGGLEKDLRYPNSKIYPEIAKTLAHMRGLYERAGDHLDFAELMSGLRASYANRPALMKALDRRRL